MGLIDRTVDHDAALREKLLAAFRAEPVLTAGGMLKDAQIVFIRRAVQVQSG